MQLLAVFRLIVAVAILHVCQQTDVLGDGALGQVSRRMALQVEGGLAPLAPCPILAAASTDLSHATSELGMCPV